MNALRGLGEPVSSVTSPEPSRLSSASLGREISDAPNRAVPRRRSANVAAFQPASDAMVAEEDPALVTLTTVRVGSIVKLASSYERGIQEHVRQGIVNTHEPYIGRTGHVLQV